jgi:hypothetical protein
MTKEGGNRKAEGLRPKAEGEEPLRGMTKSE